MSIDAYFEGGDDFNRGRNIKDNPYNYDSHLAAYMAWEEGYIDAEYKDLISVESEWDPAYQAELNSVFDRTG